MKSMITMILYSKRLHFLFIKGEIKKLHKATLLHHLNDCCVAALKLKLYFNSLCYFE